MTAAMLRGAGEDTIRAGNVGIGMATIDDEGGTSRSPGALLEARERPSADLDHAPCRLPIRAASGDDESAPASNGTPQMALQ